MHIEKIVVILIIFFSCCYTTILSCTFIFSETINTATNSTTPQLPEVTSPTTKSKRLSKIQLTATLRKIRHLLAEGFTNKEIIEKMQLEERTFYRYMRRIYEQDKAYFGQQDNESIATEIRLAKERTLKSLRRYDSIAADESLSAAERMEAERLRGDIVIALVKIELEGPRIVYDTFRRVNGQLQAKTTTAKLNNNDRAL